MTISHAWLGAVSTTTAVIKARSDQASVSATTDPATSTFNGTEGNDDVFTVSLSGLTADSAYEVTVNDGADTWIATFRTFPSGATGFEFALAGDSGQTGGGYDVNGVSPTAPTWDFIAAEEPLFMFHMGDLFYKDIATDNASLYHTAYKETIDANCATMLQSVPIVYMWDDHDYGANNSDRTSVSKPAAQQSYRDYVPHYTLPDSEAIYQTFVCGRVRFILLDVRSYRDPNTDPDGPSKTMIGSAQKTWLEGLLQSATEALIVICVGVPWIREQSANHDSWGGFSTERAEIADMLENEGVRAKTLILYADDHQIGIDNGDNSQYSTVAPDEPGPRVALLSPIDATLQDSSGPYSEGEYGNRNQQYGTIRITDDGTQLDVFIVGWQLDP